MGIGCCPSPSRRPDGPAKNTIWLCIAKGWSASRECHGCAGRPPQYSCGGVQARRDEQIQRHVSKPIGGPVLVPGDVEEAGGPP